MRRRQRQQAGKTKKRIHCSGEGIYAPANTGKMGGPRSLPVALDAMLWESVEEVIEEPGTEGPQGDRCRNSIGGQAKERRGDGGGCCPTGLQLRLFLSL